MARIRDILRQANGLPQRSAIAATAAPPSSPAGAFLSKAEPEEETPFIEVGGPNGLIEASPSVRAAVLPESARAIPKILDKTADPPTPKSKDQAHLAFRAIPPEPLALEPPAQRFASELVVLHDSDHPESKQYLQVWSGIKSQFPANSSQALLFATSGTELHAGALVLNLAIACALEGIGPVIVVDANARNPEIGKLLGIPAGEAPLRDVLAGNLSLKKAVRESGLEQLYVLLLGHHAQESAGLLAGQAMQATIRHLRDNYHWVFVSGPVWNGRPDVIALGSVCDAVYLVTADEDDELQCVIPKQGGNLRGCLVV
jgi:Mrp family chromosome partitioning ATPase